MRSQIIVSVLKINIYAYYIVHVYYYIKFIIFIVCSS